MNLFHSICCLNNVQEFIRNADYQLYQQLVERLIANILSPMPGQCVFFRRTQRHPRPVHFQPVPLNRFERSARVSTVGYVRLSFLCLRD